MNSKKLNGAAILLFLVALIGCACSASGQSTNRLYPVRCLSPDCGSNFMARPWRVDKDPGKQESETQITQGYTLWFKCPFCGEQFSRRREHKVKVEPLDELTVGTLTTVSITATNITSQAPITPIYDPVSFVNIPPGWMLEVHPLEKLPLGQIGDMIRTNGANVRLIVLVPPK